MRVLLSANGEVLGLAFGPDGRSLAAAVKGQGVFLWDLLDPGFPLQLDTAASDRTRTVAFSPDGRSVEWLSGRGWRSFDRDARRTALRRLDARGEPFRLAPAADGSRVVTLHTIPDPALIAWAPDGAGGWAREWEVSTAQLAVDRVTVDPSGRRLALLTRKTNGPRWWEQPSRLELRSATSGAVEAVGTYPYSYSCPLAFSPDGAQLVGAHGMTLLTWPVPALGDPQALRLDSRKHFTAVAFHPAGGHLLAAGNDATVHVFETAGWGRVGRFTWDLERLRSVAVSPCGTLAAAGGDHGEVVVWDLDL